MILWFCRQLRINQYQNCEISPWTFQDNVIWKEAIFYDFFIICKTLRDFRSYYLKKSCNQTTSLLVLRLQFFAYMCDKFWSSVSNRTFIIMSLAFSYAKRSLVLMMLLTQNRLEQVYQALKNQYACIDESKLPYIPGYKTTLKVQKTTLKNWGRFIQPI